MKNTGILYLRMLVTLLVSLYTSRVTLQMLGIDDFGVYGVIGGVVGLFAFLSRTLTASFNRYICIGIAHEDSDEINHVVGASVIIQFIIIAIVLILGETLGIWFINNYLVIAPEKLYAAHIVFQFSVVTFIVNIFTSAYSSIIISYERMTIYAYICIFEVIAKLAVVFALSLSENSRLELYAGYICGIQLLVLFIYHLYVRKYYSAIRPDYSRCAKYVRNMLGFAGYGFLGSFAFVIKNQGLNFLLNIFGGPALNTARSISFLVYTAVYNFVGNFQTAFSPYILKRQEIDNKLACSADVKIFTAVSFSIMSILIIPILFFVNEILNLWLGANVPPYTRQFCILILLIGLCEAVSSPLQNIIYGSGNIKWLQFGSFIIQMAVLILSYALLKSNYEPTIVYIVDLSANLMLVIYRVIIAVTNTSLNLKSYFVDTFLPMTIVSIVISYIYYAGYSYGVTIRLIEVFVCEVIVIIYIVRIIPIIIIQALVKKVLHR